MRALRLAYHPGDLLIKALHTEAKGLSKILNPVASSTIWPLFVACRGDGQLVATFKADLPSHTGAMSHGKANS